MSHAHTVTAGQDGTSDVTTLTSSQQSTSPAPPYRVLIVDDVASTRRIVGSVLESRQQFSVVGEAGDGRDAIKMAESLKPDLVLLDMNMPFVDGAKALGGVRKVAPNAKVIIFSSVKQARGARLVDVGAVGFIEKGISPFDLLERLGEILDQPSKVVLDSGVFDELRELMGSSSDELVQGLVSQFVQDTEEALIELREALKASDRPVVSRICHRIKGSALQLGGRRLALSCGRLEEDATTGSLSNCRIDLGTLEYDYMELCAELTA